MKAGMCCAAVLAGAMEIVANAAAVDGSNAGMAGKRGLKII